MSGADREVAVYLGLKLEAIKSAVKASNGDTAIAAFAPTPTPIEKGSAPGVQFAVPPSDGSSKERGGVHTIFEEDPFDDRLFL